MHTYRRSAARRFLFGLVVGSAVGGLMLSFVAAGIGLALRPLALGAPVELVIVGIAAAALGLADFSGHTPQWFRQVPQRFIRSLSPGVLGAVWGIDLGLIFTTKKITSYWGIAVLGLMVLQPMLLVVVVPIGVTITAIVIAGWSYRIGADTCRLTDPSRTWVSVCARAFGAAATLLGVAAIVSTAVAA